MSGTKFLVLHLKEIIKAGALALVGLILLIAIIYFFMPKEQSSSPQVLVDNSSNSSDSSDSALTFIPGTYSSQIPLNNSPASVEVTVTENEITNIALSQLTETQELFYPLLTPTMNTLSQEIIDSQSLNITSSVENSVTNQVLVNAISKALHEAVPPTS